MLALAKMEEVMEHLLLVVPHHITGCTLDFFVFRERFMGQLGYLTTFSTFSLTRTIRGSLPLHSTPHSPHENLANLEVYIHVRMVSFRRGTAMPQKKKYTLGWF